MRCAGWGIQLVIMQCLCADRVWKCTETESPCCASGTSSVAGQVYFQANKLIERQTRFVAARGEGWGWGNQMKVVKRTSSYKIRRLGVQHTT